MYHVVTRGNNKGNVFWDREDYFVYLKLMKKTKERYPFDLFCYCLMTNHIHLQLGTIDSEIWSIMHYINSLFSKYINEKYDLVGHLFQGRYYSEIIEDDAYALEASRYIHLNPVKANLVKRPIDYFWSSYGIYMGKRESDLINKVRILDYFNDGQNGNQKILNYKHFVENEHFSKVSSSIIMSK